MLRQLQRTIAAAYDAAPVFDPAVTDAWRALGDDCEMLAAFLRVGYEVTEVNDPMPYVTAGAMFKDISEHRIRISRANSAHPLWTPATNIAFRLVHDIHGHYRALREGAVADFSWEGELNAASAQARVLNSNTARNALFTEAVGQSAYALEHGRFDVQKVAFLW